MKYQVPWNQLGNQTANQAGNPPLGQPQSFGAPLKSTHIKSLDEKPKNLEFQPATSHADVEPAPPILEFAAPAPLAAPSVQPVAVPAKKRHWFKTFLIRWGCYILTGIVVSLVLVMLTTIVVMIPGAKQLVLSPLQLLDAQGYHASDFVPFVINNVLAGSYDPTKVQQMQQGIGQIEWAVVELHLGLYLSFVCWLAFTLPGLKIPKDLRVGGGVNCLLSVFISVAMLAGYYYLITKLGGPAL